MLKLPFKLPAITRQKGKKLESGMLEKLQTFLRITKDDSPEFIGIVRTVLIISLVATIALLIFLGSFQGYQARPTIIVLGVLFLFMAASLFFVIRGNTLPAQISIPVALIASITVISFRADSIHDQAVIAYAFTIIIGGLLQGERGVFLTAGMASIGVIFLGYADITGMTTSNMASNTRPVDGFLISVILFAIAGVLNLIMKRLNDSLKRAKESEQEQILANRELKELQISLENRVEARTKELLETSSQLERRAKDMEAVSEISHSIATIQDMDVLLPTVTKLVSEYFGYYQVGVFLMDETGENLVLRAATSEGGQRLMARKFSLKAGTTSLVGFSASQGIPRVSQDVEHDSFFLAEPDLIQTKSEAVFPLQIGRKIFGVLDIESAETNMFSENDVKILGTLANQIAISIQNVRSFEETRQALAESTKIYQQFVQQGWKRITNETPNLGYHYSLTGIKPLNAPLTTPDTQATPNGKEWPPSAGQKPSADIAIPIQLRGHSIGVLNVRPTESTHKWDEDEVALIQAAADRVALALENARLLEDSQRRAAKERTIGEISSKINASIDLDGIWQTAAKELGLAISDSEIIVQFQASEGKYNESH
jgi:GAF domain-containing protein